MLFDLIHAVPWQCMIALSLGIPGYLWAFACHFTITLSVILLNVVLIKCHCSSEFDSAKI
jgi:hypothetical protein